MLYYSAKLGALLTALLQDSVGAAILSRRPSFSDVTLRVGSSNTVIKRISFRKSDKSL